MPHSPIISSVGISGIECRSWVETGHHLAEIRCPLCPQIQTSIRMAVQVRNWPECEIPIAVVQVTIPNKREVGAFAANDRS